MKQIDKIEILKDGTILIREVEDLTAEDGSIVKSGFHRYPIKKEKGVDSIEDSKVKEIASIVWA